MLSWGGVSPSYRLSMYYFPSIYRVTLPPKKKQNPLLLLQKYMGSVFFLGGGTLYFLSLISVSCHHLNLPLTITYHHYHHHVVPLARISLALSRHFSLSFITLGRSSGLHPVSSHSCWMYVWAGRPTFVRPYVGVHRSTLLMSSCLLLQQCPTCLVHLTWIVFVMGGRWPYSWCFVGCYLQDLFNIARSILV